MRLRGGLGEKVRFGVNYELRNDQSHIITFTDAGIDQPTCTGAATSDCETDDNDVVNEDTSEVNPLHVPLIDVTGHRYRIDEVTNNTFLVWGAVYF